MAVLDQSTQTTDSVDSRLTVVDSVYSDIINSLTNVQTRAVGGRISCSRRCSAMALAGEIRGAASAILDGRQHRLPRHVSVLWRPVADANVPAVRRRPTGRPRRAAGEGRRQRDPTGERGATDVFQTLEALASAVQTATWPVSIRASPTSGRRSTGSPTRKRKSASSWPGCPRTAPASRPSIAPPTPAAPWPRTRAAESISAMTQADAAHRAALGALANAGRLSSMDYLK